MMVGKGMLITGTLHNLTSYKLSNITWGPLSFCWFKLLSVTYILLSPLSFYCWIKLLFTHYWVLLLLNQTVYLHIIKSSVLLLLNQAVNLLDLVAVDLVQLMETEKPAQVN